jgi:hypothetical protein
MTNLYGGFIPLPPPNMRICIALHLSVLIKFITTFHSFLKVIQTFLQVGLIYNF